VLLLQNVHQQLTLCPKISVEIREMIGSIAEQVTCRLLPLIKSFSTWALFLTDIYALLADLGIVIPLTQTGKFVEESIAEKLDCFSSIVDRWDVWLALSTRGDNASSKFLSLLMSTVETAAADFSPLDKFVFHNSCEQVEALLYEFSENGKTTSAASRVGGFLLDPTRPFFFDSSEDSISSKRLPTVTFFRLQSVPRVCSQSDTEFIAPLPES